MSATLGLNSWQLAFIITYLMAAMLFFFVAVMAATIEGGSSIPALAAWSVVWPLVVCGAVILGLYEWAKVFVQDWQEHRQKARKMRAPMVPGEPPTTPKPDTPPPGHGRCNHQHPEQRGYYK